MLDRLISEIADLLQISEEEVANNFTQEQLTRLLEESKCEDPGVISNFIETLDIPCQDPGSQFDIGEELTEVDVDEAVPNNVDPLECKKVSDQVNKEIKIELEEYNNISILVNKLIEFQDHTKVVEIYYQERAIRVAEVLKDFRPLLIELKKLRKEKAIIIKEIILYEFRIRTAQISRLINLLEERLDKAKNRLKSTEDKISTVEDKIENKSDAYPTLSESSITGISSSSNLSSILNYEDSSSKYISSSDINRINSDLGKYSEFIKIKRARANSYTNIINQPRVKFEVRLQGLDQINIERENFNEENGERNTYFEPYKISTNSRLTRPVLKKSINGFEVVNISPRSNSTGDLYELYYNKLEDPMNLLFTLDDKGLTDKITQLDPVLKGSNNITKRESGKDYYIKDLEKMQNFYNEFEEIFEAKKLDIRTNVIDPIAESRLRSKLRSIARNDVDLVLATAGVNTNLPEDNTELRTVVDSIKNVSIKVAEESEFLSSEIERLKDLAEKIKPTIEKIKEKLNKLSPNCFPNEDLKDNSCPDTKSKLGSDPFYQNDPDPNLPNFTQFCYWKEVSNIVNKMGLAPIPQGPGLFRYWPVGIAIPTPAKIIKIPLPIVWIPIVCVSTPLGVVVTFLTVNGLFISPVVFFVSSSGHKQHIVTVRGSSNKFGSDKDDDVLKDTFKVPVKIKAAADKAVRLAKNLKLPSVDLAKLKSLAEQEKEAISSGETDKVKAAREKIRLIKKKQKDLGKSSAEKAEDFLDKADTAKNAIAEIKSNIKKKINTIGRPQTKSAERLKEKAVNRQIRLRSKYVKALEAGDLDKAQEYREQLKTDGLSLSEKIESIASDITEYFDNIDLPVFQVNKDESKVNPAPSFPIKIASEIPVKISNLSTQVFSKKDKSVKTILNMDLAKYRKEIDENIGDFEIDLNLDNASDLVSEKSKEVLEYVIDLSNKLGNRPSLGFTPKVVNQLSSIKVEFNPFADCCAKPEIEIDLGQTSLAIAIIKQAIPLVTNYIKSLNSNQLISIFGGKRILRSRDIRLSLVNIINSKVPNDLIIQIPEFKLKESINSSIGIFQSLELPQASYPAPVKVQTLAAAIPPVDLNKIIKVPLKGLLTTYLNTNYSRFPRDLENDFVNISGSDLKSILLRFLDFKLVEVESLLDPLYRALSIAKSAKNTDLNILEKTTHSLPIYGKIIEAKFILKTLVKLNLPNSLSYSSIDLDLYEKQLELLVPLLRPLVSSPVAYLAVAAAGATGNVDKLRKLHTILNHDDLPTWERLTPSNLLFLIFVDQFIYEAAEKLGFYRRYI